MIKDIKISVRLSVAFLSIGIVFASAVIFSLQQGYQSLKHQTFNQLESVRENKKAQLEDFFAERKADLNVLANMMSNFMHVARQRLESLQEDKKLQLEQFFSERITDVKALAKTEMIAQAIEQFEAALLANGINGADWQAVETKFATELRYHQEELGYHDSLLISKKGNVVYTTAKGADLGQNVFTEKLKNSVLNTVFTRGQESMTIQDFTPYSLANNQFLSFIAVPVLRSEELIGVLVFSFTSEPIEAIIQKRKNIGQTEETYLIGFVDGKTIYRTQRTVMDKQYGMGDECKGENLEKVLTSEEEIAIKTKVDGELVLGAYTPFNLFGLHWGIISHVSLEEILTPHSKDGNFFAHYIEAYDYYDLFLIHHQGKIFFTVKHEKDYGTNILTGEYAASGLGKAVKKALEEKSFTFSDYTLYAPSNNVPNAFNAQPVIDDGRIELVVALQLSDTALNKIMTQRAGMGRTGESYLVGSDYLMRSNSQQNLEYTVKNSLANPDKMSVKTPASFAALNGETGIEIIKDYRNTSVLSAYTPLKVENTTWALLSEIDENEALAALITLKKLLLYIVLPFGILAITIIAWWLTRSIKHPLEHLVSVADSIAAGNLNNEILITQKDELGQLLQVFAKMQAQLRSITSAVKETAGIVSTASEEIAQGNLNLSQRSEQQAASLEETAASMEQMTSSVQQNADNARQAAQLANAARERAIQGGNIVGTTITSMTKISESSKKVAEIISMVDGIAFQTNMLSLNAAVEAARAGEHGRGFGVVAAEIRSLAQRTATFAKEIKNLIHDSVEKVDEGTHFARQSGETLQEIVTAVKKVSDIVAEIAAASTEQAAGIQQVNKVIIQMDEMIQQNAALVEESAAASESLMQQSLSLKHQLAFFDVGYSDSSLKNGEESDSIHSAPQKNEIPNTIQKIVSKEHDTTSQHHSLQRLKDNKTTTSQHQSLARTKKKTGDDWQDF